MGRILLVSPTFDSEFSLARDRAKLNVQRRMADSLMVPLHLATVAALTPDDFEVDIWDEGWKGNITDETDLGGEYDLVGTTGYIAQIPRCIELAKLFHRRGLPIVIGGPGVSGAPEQCREHFDVIFLGEAELTWPRFLREWKQGSHRKEYRQVERPDLSSTPVPRWDLVGEAIPHYRLAGVQTTRGCPYDCEFCDVIHLFGRKPRHKPIENVIQEVHTLHQYGAARMFLCDDDFIGDRKYAKQLLKELIPVNNSFDEPMSFSTQLTINLAQDDELLALMADCNFGQVFVGVETPRAASLGEANKVQNLRRSLVDDIRQIQSFGIGVKAGLMVGFDADDKDIFREQAEFIEEAYIAATSINTLKAYPGTPNWLRLQMQDRVLDVSEVYWLAPKVVSNVVPKQMTLPELMSGYSGLLARVRSWPKFKERMIRFVDGVSRMPQMKPPNPETRQKRMSAAKAFIDSLDPEVRAHVAEIIAYTLQKKPFMMERVGAIMMQFFMDATLLPFHQEVIQKEIDLYNAGAFKPDRDESAGMIPENLEHALRGEMPMLYGRLSSELEYKPGVQEATVSVLKDFLIRWGKGFEGFEDFHRVYLNELCDRHVERWNKRYAEGEGSFDQNVLGLTLDEATSLKFTRELLVAVEQEMRGEIRALKKHNQKMVELGTPGA